MHQEQILEATHNTLVAGKFELYFAWLLGKRFAIHDSRGFIIKLVRYRGKLYFTD